MVEGHKFTYLHTKNGRTEYIVQTVTNVFHLYFCNFCFDFIYQICCKVFSHDVTAATRVFQNNEATVPQTNRVGVIIKLFSVFKDLLLFQYISMASGQRSENAIVALHFRNLQN